MEIKKTWEIEQEHCAMKGKEWDSYDLKQWVALEELKEYLEKNTEFILTREEGCYTEEKRYMIWRTKLLEQLEEE